MSLYSYIVAVFILTCRQCIVVLLVGVFSSSMASQPLLADCDEIWERFWHSVVIKHNSIPTDSIDAVLKVLKF